MLTSQDVVFHESTFPFQSETSQQFTWVPGTVFQRAPDDPDDELVLGDSSPTFGPPSPSHGLSASAPPVQPEKRACVPSSAQPASGPSRFGPVLPSRTGPASPQPIASSRDSSISR
ncbi:unnamed protein product [Linum trigynum]|uniref:Uncharacterized protein n=1 Tax=Linum trigynum TaxID=586398 RepID=A0AAV2CJC5_9ROSI